MEKDQNQTEIKNASDEKEENINSKTSKNPEKEIQKKPKEKRTEEKI